jgi:hypothetical protein
VLLDLVLAELLTGLEPDHEGTSGLSRVEHDGRATPAGRLDFADVPALHGDACTPLLRFSHGSTFGALPAQTRAPGGDRLAVGRRPGAPELRGRSK